MDGCWEDRADFAFDTPRIPGRTTELKPAKEVSLSRPCEPGHRKRKISMKNMILAAALVGASALTAVAQTAPAPSTDTTTPAVTTTDAKNPDAPVAGANSFTEAQAKERIEKAGFSEVKDLKKDDNGIWMAAGMKDGKAVMVALDYQGNVVAK
jgi:hypothetical protein